MSYKVRRVQFHTLKGAAIRQQLMIELLWEGKEHGGGGGYWAVGLARAIRMLWVGAAMSVVPAVDCGAEIALCGWEPFRLLAGSPCRAMYLGCSDVPTPSHQVGIC